MRLGEIKKIISESLDDNNQIIIDYEAIYDSKAYTIKNYGKLIEIFDIIGDLSRNDANNEGICSVIEKYGEESESIVVSAQEFNQINNYFSQVNQKMPLYYSILETMVEEQDEQIINIKIPENQVSSLTELSKFNKRLEKILKEFNVDGEYEFKGLDKGTSWYEICIIGQFTYIVLVNCLDIAKKFFETKKVYYESKTAELDYKASLPNKEDFSNEGYKEYKEKRMDLEIEEKIKEVLEKLEIQNGKSQEELQTQLIIATKDLVKELGKGTEFHLSLNPPKYVTENGSSIQIDYKQISALIEEDNKPKGLEDKQEKKDNSEETEK